MSNLIKTYPVFESSQVLTSSQLNQVTAYLDQQSRLTRAQLIGMGIVCGFELSYDDSGGDIKITISKGTAITSEGFLITQGACTTSWVRPYNLPEGVTYAPFDNAEPQLTFHELLTKDPDDGSGAVPLDDNPGFLDDKFVLLFLEIFDNDLKACLGNTCDDLGIDRIFTIRKLLVSKSDMNELLEHAPNVGHLYSDKFSLPDIVMPRTLFDPEAGHSKQYPAFADHYADTIRPIFADLFGDGSGPGALHLTYTIYDALLGADYEYENPFEDQPVNDLVTLWKEYINSASAPGSTTLGVQYFSDFMKDLILAYDEFREAAFDLISECSPDMSRFPLHVMLGRAVVPNETPEENAKYRHGFVQPPIYNQQKDLIQRTISLHKRLLLLVRSFDLERIQTIDAESQLPIQITPSDEKNTPLSLRSIPYYYNTTTEITGVEGTLETFWNYDGTRKKQSGTLPLVYSYNNQADNQTGAINPFETPLFYDLDSYPFLRIEGHLGRKMDNVIDKITSIKHQFDLPFDVISLQLNPETDLLNPDYSCGFEDLQEEYASVRHSYCGFIRDIRNLFAFVSDNQDYLFNNSEETSDDLQHIKIIVNALHSLCDTLPDCVDDFDFTDFQDHYKDALDRILHFIFGRKKAAR
jgi:hypothetical protein